jgi:hypothetical protein
MVRTLDRSLSATKTKEVTMTNDTNRTTAACKCENCTCNPCNCSGRACGCGAK